MKRLLFLPLLILVSVAEARTYYVSAIGNDANAGTSASAAWKTLDKVNSFSFAANDTILLKRGEVFFGAVNIKRDNLTFSAYGTGAKPLITGLVNVTGWTSLGGGVYEASVTAAGKLNIVTLNGRPQQIGRYPNATDANDGYLTFEGAGSTSITDNQLSATVNWTGAEVAIRKNGWVIDRCQVTSQSGTTVNYKMGRNINAWNTPVLSPAKLNHGYFFMNDARTLDQFGEWYYDSTNKKLKMFFGALNPANYEVKVSAVDVLFNIGTSKSGIAINNIAFEGGNLSGIYALSCDNITVQYCDIANIGAKAVHIFSTANVLVENVNTNNVLSNAIQVVSRTQQNVIVRNCVVKNTSPFAGMGSYYDDSDYKGIYLVVANNLVIDYNVVDSVGLAGIQFQGSDVMVRNNFVNYFCYRLHDNGGIYTYVGGTDAAPGATYTNRLIKNNIVMNGIGAATGTNSSLLDVAGIFMDGRTMNVEVLDNTVFNSAKDGIYSNNPKNISIRGNTLYNNKDDIGFTRYAWGSINNLVIKKNVSFPTNAGQQNIYYTNAGLNTPVTTTLEANLKSLGSIDSNYYNTFSDAGIVTEIYQSEGGALLPTSPFSLDGWKSFTGYDKATKRPAQKIEPFTINNTIGSNLFSNPQFTSNITGTTVFGTNVTATWDNTSKITGTGSLRINFSSPVACCTALLVLSAVQKNMYSVLIHWVLPIMVS
jgi:parallel beta-helix repeat protein